MSVDIETSEQNDKIIPAFLAAKKEMRPAGKTGRNTFDKYNYSTEEDWHKAVNELLLKHDLLVVFSAKDVCNLDNRTTKAGGTEYIVELKGSARLYHSSGQWLQVHGCGQGQDRADKGIYKAQTGMKKYLYSLLCALPSSDDPEADATVGLSGPGKDKKKSPESKAAPKASGPAPAPKKPSEEPFDKDKAESHIATITSFFIYYKTKRRLEDLADQNVLAAFEAADLQGKLEHKREGWGDSIARLVKCDDELVASLKKDKRKVLNEWLDFINNDPLWTDEEKADLQKTAREEAAKFSKEHDDAVAEQRRQAAEQAERDAPDAGPTVAEEATSKP